MAHLDYDAIERRVSSRLLGYKRLFVHLVATLVIAAVLTVAVERFRAPAWAQDAIIPAAVLIFIAHALWLTYQGAKYFITQQEIARAESEMGKKLKRGEQLVLGDDGELVEHADEESYREKHKRD